MFIFFIPTSLATFSITSPSTFSRNPILLPPPSPFTSHFPCFPGQSLTALLSSLPFLTHPYNSHFFHLSYLPLHSHFSFSLFPSLQFILTQLIPTFSLSPSSPIAPSIPCQSQFSLFQLVSNPYIPTSHLYATLIYIYTYISTRAYIMSCVSYNLMILLYYRPLSVFHYNVIRFICIVFFAIMLHPHIFISFYQSILWIQICALSFPHIVLFFPVLSVYFPRPPPFFFFCSHFLHHNIYL